jgi:hypothetical protein
MNGRNPLVKLLLALPLGAVLSTGLAAATPMENSGPLATTPATTQVDLNSESVIEDDVALLANRKVRIKATRFVGIPFLVPRTNKIIVDVNPTLSARKSYKVVLKVKNDGTWQRCAVKYTRNREVWEGFLTGAKPNEVVVFRACRNKATRKYRVSVPAQHGFARTVVTPKNLLPNQE